METLFKLTPKQLVIYVKIKGDENKYLLDQFNHGIDISCFDEESGVHMNFDWDMVDEFLLPVSEKQIEEKSLKNEIKLQRAIGLLEGIADGLTFDFDVSCVNGVRKSVNEAIKLLTEFNKS